VVRLNSSEPRFLVARFTGLPGRPLLMQQITSFVIALAGAVFLGLTIITLYLRLRSRQAREVIARLEAGDLRARFVPERLDALGELMLDFNRMADEIERLVGRLQQAEEARRSLLQELGHDLRTPLTSLRTSIETVSVHGHAMPEADREAFIGIINSELAYFVRLIDDLFFIADIAEPHYRKNSEQLALAGILRSEMAAFQTREGLSVTLDAKDDGPVSGDRMLLARVFRNALDNAARHARGRVAVTVATEGPMVRVVVEDDGPGMSKEAIATFGQRRHQRLQAGAAHPSMSLGLGSVIIKTIVELHGGRWSIESAAAGDPVQGTRLTLCLPTRLA
jgi:signal transduction histidine kinase